MKKTLLILMGAAVSYAAAVFISLSLNPLEWSIWGRLGFVVCAIVAGLWIDANTTRKKNYDEFIEERKKRQDWFDDNLK